MEPGRLHVISSAALLAVEVGRPQLPSAKGPSVKPTTPTVSRTAPSGPPAKSLAAFCAARPGYGGSASDWVQAGHGQRDRVTSSEQDFRRPNSRWAKDQVGDREGHVGDRAPGGRA